MGLKVGIGGGIPHLIKAGRTLRNLIEREAILVDIGSSLLASENAMRKVFVQRWPALDKYVECHVQTVAK